MTSPAVRRGLYALAGLLVAAALLGVQVARADQFTHSWSPKQGPPGVAINVSGTGCIENGKPYDEADVGFFGPTDDQFNSRVVDHVKPPIAPDGSFSGTLHVPSDTKVGPYKVFFTCRAGDEQFGLGDEPFALEYPTRPTTSTTPRASTTGRPPTAPTSVPTAAATTSPTIPPTSTTVALRVASAKSHKAKESPVEPIALTTAGILAVSGASAILMRRRRRARV